MGECPPCKIIINGGLVAHFADVLATAADADGYELLRELARELSAAADHHVGVVRILEDRRVLKLAWKDFEWRGCEEAAAVAEIIDSVISESVTVNTPLAIDTLRRLIADQYRAAADLVKPH